ncbi:MAG: CHAD domain-containing protein [Rhodanobacter sp.]
MSDQTQTAIGSFLAALAQKECRAIGKALANKRNRHSAVHEARKAIRRLRCLLALIRDSVGDDTSKIEQALKSQSKRLSALRDAQVVAVLAEKLAANDNTGEWTAAARELAERRDALLASELAQDPGFAHRIAAIHDVATVLGQLHWKRIAPNALRRAIKKSRRRVLRAEHATKQMVSNANLHRWRRCVRRLRLQLVAIAALNRSQGTKVCHVSTHQGESVKALTHLAEQLGRRQDIQVLRSAFKTFSDSSILPTLRKRLRIEMRLAKR